MMLLQFSSSCLLLQPRRVKKMTTILAWCLPRQRSLALHCYSLQLRWVVLVTLPPMTPLTQPLPPQRLLLSLPPWTSAPWRATQV
jgi:hypothetical protein